MNKTTVVYMDESGNKESDRFFVCGFLEVKNVPQVLGSMSRVRDQIFAKSRNNWLQRTSQLYSDQDLDKLYKTAKTFNKFELKFSKVTEENRDLFSDLIKALWSKVDFRFNALVLDRQDPNYKHYGMEKLYSSIINTYTKKCLKDDSYIFIPDQFDDTFDWNTKINYQKDPQQVIPQSSESSLPLQIVDILTGIVGLGLRNSNGHELSNSDNKRLPILETLEAKIDKKVDGNLTVNVPRYFSIWIRDFSRSSN